ncbi:MAG: efflux RND transporter periplasmic adaptor subunit [Melioribacteraceae bacterium]|nr:efflux RND transporter periplasmic adaptor subunit [Melioribacteraceae bacterium]
MKKWKLIIPVVSLIAIIVLILVYNKSKLSTQKRGGVEQIFYVKVEKAQKKILTETISLTGTVTANNDVNIISETSGRVTAVYANVGDYKPAGSILAQVDDELKRAAFISAETNYNKAKKDLERFLQLYDQKSASDSQLDQIKLAAAVAESQYIVARRQLEDTKIKTPISGYITARYIDVGSMVQGAPQQTLIANVVDISRLKIKVNVAEKDAVTLKPGDNVSVMVDVFPKEKFVGKVDWISSKGDDAHTFPVEISIKNESGRKLKAGLFARVEFSNLKNQEELVIPREALIGSARNPKVYVVNNGIAYLKPLVISGIIGNYIRVIDGIKEGDAVVTNGQSNLSDKTEVNILN